jgi:hypothetical protein
MASPAGLQIPKRARWTGLTGGGEPAAGFNVAGAVDGLTQFAVLAFASWTLIYDIGAVADLGTSWLLVLWAACLVAIAVGLVRFGRAGPAGGAGAAEPIPGLRWLTAATPWRRPLGMASVVLGVAAGLAVGLHSVGLPWNWTWVLGGPAVVVTLTWLLLPAEGASSTADRPTGAVPLESAPSGPAAQGGSLLALGTAVVAAIFSLYIVRPDADDAYFVSRAVWAAQHGRIPLKDIIFTHQAVNQISAETPVSSIEVLIGALARLLGVPAASFTYYIALPVFVFVAVWAVWLLIRRWAPDRYVLCFAVAMLYLAWSGTSSASFGSFHLVRMWQGKGAFLSLMVPLLYVYLTQWAEHRSRRSLLVVIAAGIAATGLTSSAALVVPLIVAAVAVPLLLARQIAAALGALLAAAYPVLAGLVVAVVRPVHLPHSPFAPATAWAWVLLAGVLGGIGGVALWTAPRLARRGVPALITSGVAGVITVLMLPGVLTVMGNATGTNAVTWRTMWVVPGPVAGSGATADGRLAAAHRTVDRRAAAHRTVGRSHPCRRDMRGDTGYRDPSMVVPERPCDHRATPVLEVRSALAVPGQQGAAGRPSGWLPAVDRAGDGRDTAAHVADTGGGRTDLLPRASAGERPVHRRPAAADPGGRRAGTDANGIRRPGRPGQGPSRLRVRLEP